MNHSAEIAALKKRLSELEAKAVSEQASEQVPATVGERYGNAVDMARRAEVLPGGIRRDECGMIRLGDGTLATPDQVEAVFAMKPEMKPKPQVVTPADDAEELSPTEKRLAARRAANEAADKAFQQWSKAGLPKGWFRDTCGVLRTPDGKVAPVVREGPANE
jgi:hypothetical protein